MTAILHIYDGSFEDGDLYVVADQIHELGAVAAQYMRVAAPQISSGRRVVVPDEEPAGGWVNWVINTQMDFDYLDFEFYDDTAREVYSPDEMKAWISFHAAELHRQHTPPTTIVTTDLL